MKYLILFLVLLFAGCNCIGCSKPPNLHKFSPEAEKEAQRLIWLSNMPCDEVIASSQFPTQRSIDISCQTKGVINNYNLKPYENTFIVYTD